MTILLVHLRPYTGVLEQCMLIFGAILIALFKIIYCTNQCLKNSTVLRDFGKKNDKFLKR